MLNCVSSLVCNRTCAACPDSTGNLSSNHTLETSEAILCVLQQNPKSTGRRRRAGFESLMGAVFFMTFMAIIFFTALFFFIAFSVLIVIWIVRKRRGKAPRAWWLVISSIFLTASILALLVPLGYIGFLRYAANMNPTEVVYAESGKMLYWPTEGKEDETTTNWFEMDGVKYVRLREAWSSDPFFTYLDESDYGAAIANIQNNPSTRNPFFDGISILIIGQSASEAAVSTVYPVPSSNGFELYDIVGAAGGGYFCREDKCESIRAFYSDYTNYDTLNIVQRYSVYSDGEGLESRGDASYITIEENTLLDAGVFEEIHRMRYSPYEAETVEIPEKYRRLDEEAKPGTPIFGYDSRELIAYSNDGVFFMNVILVLIDDQVYAESGLGGGYIYGYPLSPEMNEYVLDSVFGMG